MFTAKDIMTKEVISVSSEMKVVQAAKILLEKGFNGVPVIEKGNLVGVLCQSDLIAQQKRLPIPSFFTLLDSVIPLQSTKHFEKAVHRMAATTVADVMTSKPTTVHPDTSIEELASLMLDKKIDTIPVVDKGALVGIIGKADIMRTLLPDTESIA